MKTGYILLLIVCAFIYGVVTATYQLPPYQLMKNAKHWMVQKNNQLWAPLTVCSIENTDQVFAGSQAFIGHAYGKESGINHNLSPAAIKFLREYSSTIERIIFTGDIFAVPSLEKWKNLALFKEYVEIIVSPGNHDFLRPDSRDVFKQSDFYQQYPLRVEIEGASLIIENSTATGWKIAEETISLANSSKAEVIIIARHHPPISELGKLSNSQAGNLGVLETSDELIKKFDDRRYTWIIGDGGWFAWEPAVRCFAHKNHTFILNGLGNSDKDTILIFHKEKIYSYKLKT